MDLNLLRSLSLFEGLDEIQLSHLASIISTEHIPKGKILFNEGEVALTLYIIKTGKIRISKIVPGIGEEALAILEKGAYFGEMEFIDRSLPRAAQAIAHENCELLAIGYAELQDMLSSDYELAQAFLWSMVRTLSQRLRDTNDKVTAMFALAQF